jgi:predicted Zn finger-like uncharacterized protein
VKISCPNCPAAYELDDSRIPPAGLSIKCPRCKTPFIVHKPKPGDTSKVVKGSAVPLPGQAGAKPSLARPAGSRPPPSAVPLPGVPGVPGGYEQAEDAAASASPDAVPLPGIIGDEPPLDTTAVDFRPPLPGPAAPVPREQQQPPPRAQKPPSRAQPPPPPPLSVPPPMDFGAVPLPGLDDGPLPPARASSRPPAPRADPDEDYAAPAPAANPPAADDPFGLDFDLPPAASRPAFQQDEDFPAPPAESPPEPFADAAEPRPAASAMDDIFAVDVPEPAPPPPPASRPALVDEPGISFDFVEPPPPPRPSAPPPRADLLDFVDDKPDEDTALRPVEENALRPVAPETGLRPVEEAAVRSAGKSEKAEKAAKARRPPPTIAPSAPARFKGGSEDELSLDLDGHAGAPPAPRDDSKKVEQERKKQEKDDRKQRERAESARRKESQPDRVGPLLSNARERLRNPRVLGASVLGLLLLVVVAAGIRARSTPAGLFWMNSWIPSRKAASPTETRVIEKGMERLSDGSFAAAREALGMAAQLLAVLPDDDNVKSFFVLSASELKLAYNQVGGDWDQAKRVVEKIKANSWAQNRARGAFALATGDLAKGKLLLAPLGDRPDADLESIYLYAQSLILGGEQARGAQVLDNALKGKGGDSTKLLLLRGLVARQKGQLPEAAGFFERALQKSPGNGRALIELADVKLRQGDVKTTADLLDKTLQPDLRKTLDATEEGRASMLRGRLMAVNHRNKEAEAAYDHAVELDPASAEIREAYGEFRNSRREWEKAAKQFDAALASGNATPAGLAGAARAYLGTNRLLDADKRINEAVSKDNQSAHFIYMQGRVAEAIGKGDEAFKDYERALARKADLAEALAAEGQIFLARADKIKAQERLAAALKAPVRTSVEDEAVGDLALALGNKEQARDAFSSALLKDPEDPQAHAGMGKTLAVMGDLKAARVELEKALGQVDNDASLEYEYGSLLRRAGESDNALAALQKAVKIDGKDPRYRSRLGALLVERRDFEAAEAQLRQAVLMNDRYAEGQFFLARALAGQKKLAEAVDIARRAVELDADNPEYLYSLGLIYEQGQQVQDAIESFQKSIDKDPKSADTWEHLGQNFTIENRFNEAVNAFKKAADLDPKRARVWAEVGDSEQQSGDIDGAIRDFQKALAQDSSLPGVWSKLGVAYKDKDCKGCKTKAMDALRRGAQLDPTDAVAHHELGYMYKDDGRRKEAIAEFKRYLALRPDAGDLSTVQDDIYYLQEESRRAP